jgi:SAM-dependent methyltransferase
MNPAAYGEMAEVQGGHWWYVGRRRILREQLRSLALPSDAAILEVGSGTGANLGLLAEFGRVAGLEMEERAIEFARRSLGDRHEVRLVHGRCPDDLHQLGERYDLVCLFDVLEHIAQDREALRRLRTLLKPDGRILLSVPAYQWMWGPHDEHFHHQRRYSKAALVRTCENAGLAVSRTCHFNTLLFPLAVAERMRERWTGRRGAATRLPPPRLNALLSTVFGAERHLVTRMAPPFGLSLLLVAGAAPTE